MNNNDLAIKDTFALAVKNHKESNFGLAKSLYQKILKIRPNHFESNFLLGSLLLQTKDFPEAVEMLKKTIKLNPKHSNSYQNLGFAFVELGQLQKAIELFNKAILIQPKHVGAYFNLGNVFKQMGEYEKAKNAYEKTLQFEPNHAQALNNLGNIFKELGNLEKAIKSYEKAIEIKTNHPNAYHNLGNVLKQLGEFKKAKNAYEKSFKYNPVNLESLHALSELDNKILDSSIKKEVDKIMKNKNLTGNNIAYGNFLYAKYEKKQKNIKNEFDYLKQGHLVYFEYKKKFFTRGIKYWLSELPLTKELMSFGRRNKGDKKNDSNLKPIFIIGVPRCGSTLIEKIIASGAKKIPIGEEIGVINFFVGEEIVGKRSLLPDIEHLKKNIIKKYEENGLLQKKSDYIFTDKTLDNFFFIGLIKEIFPYAKIINCKRNALSSIMSILKNNLGGVSWAHNLEHIFQYFDIYYKKIEEYKKIFPKFIYEVELEKFVNDPMLESKYLLEFCDLPWDKKCLEFYKRKDLISKTASNIQIRKAIYKESMEKHLPYKKFLNTYGNKYPWFNKI